jgi:hypothetical protein
VEQNVRCEHRNKKGKLIKQSFSQTDKMKITNCKWLCIKDKLCGGIQLGLEGSNFEGMCQLFDRTCEDSTLVSDINWNVWFLKGNL